MWPLPDPYPEIIPGTQAQVNLPKRHFRCHGGDLTPSCFVVWSFHQTKSSRLTTRNDASNHTAREPWLAQFVPACSMVYHKYSLVQPFHVRAPQPGRAGVSPAALPMNSCLLFRRGAGAKMSFLRATVCAPRRHIDSHTILSYTETDRATTQIIPGGAKWDSKPMNRC